MSSGARKQRRKEQFAYETHTKYLLKLLSSMMRELFDEERLTPKIVKKYKQYYRQEWIEYCEKIEREKQMPVVPISMGFDDYYSNHKEINAYVDKRILKDMSKIRKFFYQIKRRWIEYIKKPFMYWWRVNITKK